MLLIYLSAAWIAGILLGSVTDSALPFLAAGLALAALSPLLRRHARPILLGAACLALVAAGVSRLHASLPDRGPGHLRHYNDGGIVTITGTVNREPEAGDRTTRVTLSVREMSMDGERRAVEGAVLLFVPRYPEYAYGDVLSVSGEPETPPLLGDFDYAGYLANRGIHSTMLYPEIEVLDTGRGSSVLAWVYSLRDSLADSLAAALPEPQASLAQGMVLGMRGGIPPDVRQDFARSGTSHLLAISGLHLSIIAGLLVGLGARLFGRRYHIHAWLALALIWLYALLTGLQPPILRAAIMVSLFLAAEMLGRQRSSVTALSFAAALMVAVNPRILWDAAFQLSFLAMLGLLLLSPRLQTLAARVVPASTEGTAPGALARYVADTGAITMGVLLAVWPVIAYHFGIVSLVAPLATLLALPALPAVIITGGGTAILGAVLPAAAQVVGWLAWLPASYLQAVVGGLASLPAAAIEMTMGAPLVLAYYTAFGVAGVTLVWAARGRRRPRVPTAVEGLLSGLPARWVLPPLAATALLACIAVAMAPDDNLHVSFLDVGQGDAVLIQTAQGHDILVDGGPDHAAVTRVLGRKMPFWDRRIDMLVLTHPHSDHLAGLIEVLRRYRVQRVLQPAAEYESPMYDEWLRLVEEKGVAVSTAREGLRITSGDGLIIEVLGPDRGLLQHRADADDLATVLRVRRGRVSFLLTADIGREAEAALATRRTTLGSTVLKVGHHGSATSTSPAFLATVEPVAAVISVGGDNRFGHPDEEVTARLDDALGPDLVYRTDRHGTIEFITNGTWLRVRVERMEARP